MNSVTEDARTRKPGPPPRHVAFILDGNRRWARDHGRSVDEGHRAGIAKVAEVLGWCEEAGLDVATLWLLSVGNLARPPAELAGLFEVYRDVGRQLTALRRWRVRPIGFLDLLPPDIAEIYREAEKATAHLPGLQANIALAYDGRHEILAAVRSLLTTLARQDEGGGGQGAVSPEQFSEHLFTWGQPDPDLVIRTSGEQRLSGFLTWQTSQSELYFCDIHWPDFDRSDFHAALHTYARRRRRFGA